MRALGPVLVLSFTLGCFDPGFPVPPGGGPFPVEGEGEGEGDGDVCRAQFLLPNNAGSGLFIFDGLAQEDTTADNCLSNGNGATAVGFVQAIISPPYALTTDGDGVLLAGQIAVAIEGEPGARFADLGAWAISTFDAVSPCGGEEDCFIVGALCIPPGTSPVAMQLFDAEGETSQALCVDVDVF
jgi:hypothetical protein